MEVPGAGQYCPLDLSCKPAHVSYKSHDADNAIVDALHQDCILIYHYLLILSPNIFFIIFFGLLPLFINHLFG